MNPPKILLGAVGAVFVAAALIWIDATRSARDTAAALDAAAQNRTSLREAARRAEVRLATLEKVQADAQSALDRLRTAPPVVVASAPAKKPEPAPMAANPRELLAKDPTLQTLWLNSGRARLTQEYGPLFESLRLTPAEIEQFAANVMKRQEQMMDLAGAAQTQGTDSKSAIATLQKQANDEFAAAQTALLGAEGFREMQDYERSTPARAAVEGLVGAATLDGAPLTAEQAAQLAAAIANASSRFATGGRADLATINWDTADAQARHILTPAQFALYKSAAPVGSGVSRWNLQLDAAIARAKESDATRASARPPGT